jgi:hypothetical protein
MVLQQMTADWKIVGAGGGVKNAKLFCTLCPLESIDVHQPNTDKCQRFCHDKDESWCCYHHPILCGATKDSLLEEIDNMKFSIASDLEDISSSSKIKFFPNPCTPGCTTHKQSLHYLPIHDDDRDQFMDLLIDE